MFRKKAQKSGGQAAVVVAMIAVVLIAYILFLPPEERDALLDGDTGGSYYTGSSDDDNITILNVSSMRLEYVGEDEYDHTIPNLYLRESTESNVIESFNPFYIKNGWFDKKEQSISFFITDLENTDNIALSFVAPEAEGILMISLNGALIFEYETTQENVGPIELKKELLQKGENTIVFTVSGVGIKFWSTNEYSIEETKVTGDITDISQRESMNVFTIKNEEYYNLERSYVEFYPVCDQKKVGVVDVLINNKKVFSSVPDCNMLNRQDIYSTDLNAGKNTIAFKTEEGSYRVELIKVKTKLKEIKTFLEYFEVNSTAYEEVQDNDRDVWLEITFVDDRETKEAQINVNGHLAYFDQKESVYRRRIDSWVESGARNYIEIKPFTVLKIVDIKINLVEK